MGVLEGRERKFQVKRNVNKSKQTVKIKNNEVRVLTKLSSSSSSSI